MNLRTDARISRFFLGTIGHVAHGKSSVVKAISGVQVRYTLYHLHFPIFFILNNTSGDNGIRNMRIRRYRGFLRILHVDRGLNN